MTQDLQLAAQDAQHFITMLDRFKRGAETFAQAASAQTAATEATAQVNNLREQADAAVQKLADLQGKTDALRTEHDQWIADAKAAADAKTVADKAVRIAEVRLEELQAQHAEQQALIDAAAARVAAANAALSNN